MPKNDDIKDKRIGCIQLTLLLLTAFICIKRIFVDFDSDSGYAVALAYRIINGDAMFTGMWEPHQTSGFFCAFFELIYVTLFHTTKGIVLYLGFIGVICKSIVAFILYCALKDHFKKETAFIASCIFMILSPKLQIIPEYSNLQLYSSVLVFVFLISYIGKRKIKYLILISIFLFGTVLAYPSCVLMWLPVAVILLRDKEKGLKDLFVLTSVCLILGCAYISFFVIKDGWSEFAGAVGYIVTSDPSHSMTLIEKIKGYIFELIVLTMAFLIIYLISKAFVYILEKTGTAKIDHNKMIVISSLLLTALWAVFDIFSFDTDFCFNEFLFGILVFAVYFYRKKRDPSGGDIFALSIWISAFELFSTCILSNLSFYSSAGYMTLAYAVACAFLIDNLDLEYKGKSDGSLITCLILIPVIFINLFICRSISFCYMKITDIRGVSKTGPSFGVFSEYMGPYILDNTFREWQVYVPDGSCVLISGNMGMLDGATSLEYLDKAVNIGIKDTQTSCIIDESQEHYWEMNPDKVPDVVVTVCWFGENKEHDDSWLLGWISENYADENGIVHYIDGMYRRYYYSPELWNEISLKLP